MTWLTADRDRPSLDDLLAHRPELKAKYQTFYASIREAGLVPPRLLEICRLRMAAIHDCAAEWTQRDAEVEFSDAELAALKRGDVQAFAPLEQAALTVTERLPYQHHELTDAEVATLKSQLGDAGCVSLINALVLFDVNCRLKLTFGLQQ